MKIIMLPAIYRTEAKVKRGVAWRVVGDVGHWAKKYKHDMTANQAE